MKKLFLDYFSLQQPLLGKPSKYGSDSIFSGSWRKCGKCRRHPWQQYQWYVPTLINSLGISCAGLLRDSVLFTHFISPFFRSFLIVPTVRVRNADSRYFQKRTISLVHHHYVTQGWIGDLGCCAESLRWTGIWKSSGFLLSVSLASCSIGELVNRKGMVLTANCRFV